MKKTIVFIATIMCGISMAISSPVSYSKAKAIADRFVSSAAKIDGEEAKLVYSPLLPNQNRPAFYAFNYGNEAFVIVSGDDVSFPILGYSFSKGFPSNVPSNIQAFLSDLAMELDAAIEQRIPQSEDIAQQWEGLMYGTVSPKDASDTVGPLLTTQWDQGQYYNSFCPVDPITQNHTPTGCVATAMAQVIKYWQYPVSPRGSYSYSSNYGTLGINLDTVNYNFSIMPNQLTSSTSNAEVNEVAALLYHCGVTLQMNYDTLASSAYNASARAALANHFGYSSNMNIASKSYYSYLWNNMLKTELDASRPVLYSGTDPSIGGHSFVCDGYSGNYFHFNFGWSGWGDGYFLTSAINPTFYGILDLGQYNSNQAAIFGIQPDSSASTLFSQYTGNSRFVVDRPLDFYNIKALNTYSSNQFSNICSHKITFSAQDTSNRLLLEIINPNSENLYIYDGDGTSSQIRHLTGNNSAASLSSITSSGASLTLWDLGYSYNNGFHIRVSEINESCSSPSGIVVDSLWASGCSLSWNNADAIAWQIEYGLQGFGLGNGTTIDVNTPTVILSNLASHTTYDIYIRGFCADSSFSQCSTISVTTPYAATEYWYEVVTSQPSGYSVSNNYDVHISSREGLAWLLSVCNGLNGAPSLSWQTKKIILECDVDMSEYLWLPMKLHKTFDGGMHAISGLTVIEDSSIYVGFIESMYSSDTIRNIVFPDCNINNEYAYGYTGGVVGSCHGTIINCGISGHVSSVADNTGGIAGNNFGNIINSYSTANVTGKRFVGGITGQNASYSGNHSVLNCYATGNVTSNNPYTYSQDYAGVVTGKVSEDGNGEYLAYWLQGSQPQVGCENNTTDFQPFNGNGTQWSLINPITIGSQSTDMLIEALNLWVNNNNQDGLICGWTADTNNVNGGLPIFAHNNFNDTVYYTLTVTSNDISMGSVSGSGVYSAGSVVTVTASPFAGFAFTHWSDNDTNAVRTITIVQDVSLIAYFSTSNPQGIGDQEPERVTIYAVNNRIHIDNNNSENVVIYTIDGKLVCEGVIKQSPYLANGVYLVKLGNTQVVKVVVSK